MCHGWSPHFGDLDPSTWRAHEKSCNLETNGATLFGFDGFWNVRVGAVYVSHNMQVHSRLRSLSATNDGEALRLSDSEPVSDIGWIFGRVGLHGLHCYFLE